jgi:hypothetical protein
MDLSRTPPDYNPFAESSGVAAPAPEAPALPAPAAPSGVPILFFVVICAVALVLVGWLFIRAGRLQAEADAFRAQASAARSQSAQAAALQARVDQLSAESAERERFQSALLQAEGLRIISAVYGSGGNVAEVTHRVSDLLRATNAEFYTHPGSLGADPAPGWNKQLTIIYEFQGRRHLFTTGEGGRVSAAGLREVGQP